MKKTLLFASALSFAMTMNAQLKVTNLRVEHMANPTAVDETVPRFSWINEAIGVNERGKRQTAYQIGVASSLEKARVAQFDVWNSQKQPSSQSILIPYEGLPLRSGTDYYWCVRTWDENGTPSVWSEVNTWGMGLLKTTDWKGKWISPAKTTNAAPMMRRTFAIGKTVKQAKVFICGLGFHQLYMNGQRIGNDELVPNISNYSYRDDLHTHAIALNDKFTGYRVLYMSYDVTKQVKLGENAIGVLLGHGWAKPDKHIASHFTDPCLRCQINVQYTDGTSEVLAPTDESWKVKTSAIHYNGLFQGELYDARHETPQWNTAQCDESGWEQAITIAGPTGQMSAMTSPADKIMETLKPKTFKKREDGRYEVDFGEEISGWIRLKDIVASAGDTIRIDYECESPQGIQRYVAKGTGRETYAPHFTWFVFRKAYISGIDQLIEANLQAEAVYTDVRENATFDCSNPLFNQILTIWKRSQKDNMHGSIASDCPHRERLPYTGDGQGACGIVMEHFDAAAFYAKWIRDVRDAQDRTDGYVPNSAPWQPGAGGGVAWGAAMNVMPWEFYLNYGDTRLLEQCYEPMKRQLDYMTTWMTPEGVMFQQRASVGQKEPMYWLNLGDWCPPDHSKIAKESLVHTFYLWHCADITSRAARVLGHHEDAVRYAQMAEQVRTAFDRVFFDEKAQSCGPNGDNIFALCMGLGAEHQPQLINTVRKEIAEGTKGHVNVGFIGAKYFFETLARHGMNDLAYEAMNKTDFPSYGHWIAQGATTTWERWDGGNSRNHPMMGSGLTWFSRNLAGVQYDEHQPAYRHIIIRPQVPAQMEYVSYTKQTPYGKVASSLQRKDGITTVTVTVPVGSTATLVLPIGTKELQQGTYTFKYSDER